MSASPARPLSESQPLRCAVYTRVSTDERLGQEFNSLHNQREAAESYIKAQRHEGWERVPGVYEDAGFSGGSLVRPALQRLLADVKAGNVQRIIVYRMDRISRSMRDFLELAAVLEEHGASIVSITEHFDSQSPSGRLARDISLRFAQHERELISERTHHKMAASRRKGKRVGGMLVLGYDADESGKLVINETEAAQVRTIFRLYEEHQGLLPVVQELNHRGWRGKTWRTKAGHLRHGKAFTKNRLHRLLSNWTYAGKVNYQDKVYEGEHDGIVDEETFRRVQDLLERNRVNGGSIARSRYGSLLSGILHCTGCDRTMIHCPTTRGKKTYRYYRCTSAMQKGKDSCSGGSVPAPELERLVVGHIKAVGKDPEVVLATLTEARQQLAAKQPALKLEAKTLRADLGRHKDEMNRLVGLVASGDEVAEAASTRIADLQETIKRQEARLKEIRSELKALADATVDEADLRRVLAEFDGLWGVLYPAERVRVLNLLIQRVDYDAAAGKVALTFRPTGIKALAAETAAQEPTS